MHAIRYKASFCCSENARTPARAFSFLRHGGEFGVEGIHERTFNLVHRGAGAWEEALHGGNGAAETTGVDQVEEGEVGGDVEGDSVERDPAAEFDADGADFGEAVGRGSGAGIADPDAGGAFGALAGDFELAERADDGFFEEAHVGVQVEAVAIQIDDRVGDELPRAVEGDVAAAIGFDDLDSAEFEHLRGGQKILLGIGAAADGDDGGVFNEHEHAGGIVGLFGEHALVELELQVPRGAIGHAAGIDDLEEVSHRGLGAAFLAGDLDLPLTAWPG